MFYSLVIDHFGIIIIDEKTSPEHRLQGGSGCDLELELQRPLTQNQIFPPCSRPHDWRHDQVRRIFGKIYKINQTRRSLRNSLQAPPPAAQMQRVAGEDFWEQLFLEELYQSRRNLDF